MSELDEAQPIGDAGGSTGRIALLESSAGSAE